ncbi:hypothetical protein BJV77DRAFT_1150165 [Russula vinacea]|nr:hypothetical protein BJV77DRAFT_1150165 [Russula vinacea]
MGGKNVRGYEIDSAPECPMILKNVPWMIPPWNGIYVGVVSQWLRFNLASHFASEHVTYLIPRFAFPTKHGVFASVLDSRPRGWITLVKGDHDGAIVPLRRCGLWHNYCGLLSAARRLCHGPLAIGDDRKAQEGQSRRDRVKMLIMFVPKFALSRNLSWSNDHHRIGKLFTGNFTTFTQEILMLKYFRRVNWYHTIAGQGRATGNHVAIYLQQNNIFNLNLRHTGS